MDALYREIGVRDRRVNVFASEVRQQRTQDYPLVPDPAIDMLVDLFPFVSTWGREKKSAVGINVIEIVLQDRMQGTMTES
jgi:hypothetical protein